MKVLPLLSWLSGMITPLLWEQLPSLATLAAFAGLALALLVLKWRHLAVFLVGICYTSLVVYHQQPPALSAQDHSIEGTVLAEQAALYVQIYRLDDQAVSPFLARLGWYLDQEKPVPGQVLAASARLKPLRHRLNPGSRASARRDKAMGLVAVGYVKDVVAIKGAASWQWRWHRYLERQLAGFGQQGLMLALLSGDRQLMATDTRALLAQTGTAHLLAISGLHVSLVAMLGLFLGHLLPGNGRRWGWLLGLLMAGLYAWQSGLAPPALRALVALGAWVLWLGWRRPLQGARLWLGLLSLFATLDPMVLLDSRLWLSFFAVALILLVLWRFPGRGWRSLIILQLGLGVLMWPLQSWLFGQVPAFALIANLFAVPLISLLVMPLLLAGLVVPGLWWLADQLLAVLMIGLTWLPGEMPAAWLGLLLLPLIAALPLNGRSRLALGLCWLMAWGLRPQSSGVWFLDVGQGTSTALIAPKAMVLVDTGPGLWATDGARRLAASHPLALLVLSHSDKDHVGGRAAFSAPVLAGQPDQGEAPCIAGQRWFWQGGVLETLWPEAPGGEDNDRSCVLFTQIAGHTLLLTGDISQGSEALRHWPEADWLAVPHHGSKSSSSEGFIQEVNPRLAVFSRGWQNPFGFPAPQVLARYRANGSAIWDTGRQGALFCAKSGCQGLKALWWEATDVGEAKRCGYTSGLKCKEP
ncbi:DNA internalization-related competence protein ComEC/Rec2 [Gallaecimonas pentaromativorans]|uniref:DNA internalization-related competence protein ComEC/Rec2 n=1 Tax=Gallaecimonas pentaromativorans TaxID=584787 RepID=UPI003A957AFA